MIEISNNTLYIDTINETAKSISYEQLENGLEKIY